MVINASVILTLNAELGSDFGSGLRGRSEMRRRSHSNTSRRLWPWEGRRQRASVSIRSGVLSGLRNPFRRPIEPFELRVSKFLDAIAVLFLQNTNTNMYYR